MNRILNTRFASLIHARSLRTLALLATLLLSAGAALAQTTAFTYQGRLTDGGSPANGNYDLQVKLFDAATAGNQVGATNSINAVTVTGGVFTATLDFGATAFSGANRWAEISARPSGNSAFTTLTPRQPVTSTPYAIRSLSAAAADNLSASCNGCVTGAQIGSLPATSGNYIQNTATPQAGSNFNISGNGIIGARLGIGTGAIAPATALDVNGIISLKDGNNRLLSAGISSESFTQTIHIGVNNSRVGGYDPTKQGGFFRVDGRSGGLPLFQFFTSVGDASLVSIMPDGKVGIGTGVVNPGSLLTLKASSATAPALEVNQGAIKVTGAAIRIDKNGTGTAVFIHKTTATNILDGFTTFIENHPMASGDPNAILLVTLNRNPGLGAPVDNPHPIGVVFDGGNWRIYNVDGATMPVGVSFNIMVIKP
ncbi:MAG: hypothetical protein ABIP14_10750 [Blastocatellia bacterium]